MPAQARTGRAIFILSERLIIEEFNIFLKVEIFKLCVGNVPHIIDVGTSFQKHFFISSINAEPV